MNIVTYSITLFKNTKTIGRHGKYDLCWVSSGGNLLKTKKELMIREELVA